MRSERPPQVPRIIALLIPSRHRCEALGDLVEEYCLRRAAGRLRARFWFWGHVGRTIVASRWYGSRVRRARSFRGALTLESIRQDFRLGRRMLVREWPSTVIALVTMTLGIGATTAIYSVVHAVLLQPLPYPEPDALVEVLPYRQLSRAEYARLSEAVESFEGLTAHVSGFAVKFTSGLRPEQSIVSIVSPGHFAVVGVEPLHGRSFVLEDVLPGAPPVGIISHALWQRRYGGDRSVVGRTVLVDGLGAHERRILGVMPPGYRPLGENVDVWTPLIIDPAADDYGYAYLSVLGRLGDEIRAEAAAAEIGSLLPLVFPSLEEEVLDRLRRPDAVVALHESTVREVAVALRVLLGAVAFVVLTVFLNIANLMLARSAARQREYGTRLALGATRLRLLQQALVEGLCLALLGGACGVWFAYATLPTLVASLPDAVPRVDEIRLDLGALGAAAAISLIGGLAVGTLPALRLPASRIPAAVRAHGGVPRRHRAAALVVAAQMALAIVLASGGAVSARSVWNLVNLDSGFDPHDVLAISLSPPSARLSDSGSARAYLDEVTRHLMAIAGVESVGWVQRLPMTPYRWFNPYFPEGRAIEEGEEPPLASFRVVSPGYFETLRVPRLAGRALRRADDSSTPRVAVVNETLARGAWPGENAVGKSLRFTRDGDAFEIVGVFGDVRQHRLGEASLPEVYVSHRQVPIAPLNAVIRVAGSPEASATAIRGAVAEVDRGTPITLMTSLVRLTRTTTADARFLAGFLVGFGFLATTVAAGGVYGVTSRVVAQRVGEYGLRMALGAGPRRLVRGAVVSAMSPIIRGMALGAVLSVVLSSALASLLHGVSPGDPIALTVAASLLTSVAFLAIYFPARRAGRVDPVVSLRAE